MTINSYSEYLNFFYPYFENYMPTQKPPKLITLLKSYCMYELQADFNYKNLAEIGRTLLFDFEYNLKNEDKAKFEEMIINHFIMRRIGYETFTSFYLSFKNKILENVSKYDLLFSAIADYQIKSGEDFEYIKDNEFLENQKNQNIVQGLSEDRANNKTITRYNDTPQGKMFPPVGDTQYLTNLTENDFNINSNNNSKSTSTENNNKTGNGKEIFKSKRSVQNQLDNILKFQEDYKSIYNVIYNDLDICFYQLV